MLNLDNISSSEDGESLVLNNSAQDHRSSIIKVFGYQNINVLMKNDYYVHGSTILKVGMKLKEVQAHPERLSKTPSPRVGLHGGRKVLEQLVVSPSFDVDSFSLKSPPRLAHAHTVNSEILSASLDVSSVNLLQNNPRNPIIAKRNPNIERMIQDNKFMSPKASPSMASPSGDKKLRSFSSFGLYRSASCSSTVGHWSNNTSLDEMSASSNNLRAPLNSNSTTLTTSTATTASGTASGATSTDTNDYSVGLCTTMEEVMTMLSDASLSSPRTKMSGGVAEGSPGEINASSSNSSSNSPSGLKMISFEPSREEVRQHQMQLFHSMREFVDQEYHRGAY